MGIDQLTTTNNVYTNTADASVPYHTPGKSTHFLPLFYGNGQNTKIAINHPCTIPLGIIVFGFSFAATLGTVERTAFGTFDQISDAGLAVVVKTRQDFGLLEVVRAYWARELVVQFLEARGEQISTTLSHLAPLGDRSRTHVFIILPEPHPFYAI